MPTAIVRLSAVAEPRRGVSASPNDLDSVVYTVACLDEYSIAMGFITLN